MGTCECPFGVRHSLDRPKKSPSAWTAQGPIVKATSANFCGIFTDSWMCHAGYKLSKEYCNETAKCLVWMRQPGLFGKRHWKKISRNQWMRWPSMSYEVMSQESQLMVESWAKKHKDNGIEPYGIFQSPNERIHHKVQAAGMRSKQCRCYPCCSSHPRTRLLGLRDWNC